MTHYAAHHPVPVSPDAGPLNLVPGADNSAARGAMKEKIEWSGTLTIGPDDVSRPRRDFWLVTRLSALDMGELQAAEESGSILNVMRALPRLVRKGEGEGERVAFLEYLFEDPEDERDYITLKNLLAVYHDAMEQISNRPTDR